MARNNNKAEATTTTTTTVTYLRVGSVEPTTATDTGAALDAILLEGPALEKAKPGPGRPPAPEAFTVNVNVEDAPEWAIALTGSTRWLARRDDAGKRTDPSKTVACETTSTVAPTERAERARKGIVVEKLSREQAEMLFARLEAMLKG